MYRGAREGEGLGAGGASSTTLCLTSFRQGFSMNLELGWQPVPAILLSLYPIALRL